MPPLSLKAIRKPVFMAFICALTGFFSACEPGDCNKSNPPRLLLGLYHPKKEDRRYFVAYKDLMQIRPLFNALSDTVPRQLRGDDYYLPLNNNADSSGFILIDTFFTDTMVVTYTREPYFQSKECGFLMRYKNLKVKWHTFDSVKVTRPIVDSSYTASPQPNILVLFRQ